MTATRLEADATQLFVEIERLYGEGQYFTAFQRVRRGGIPGRAARDIDPKVALLAARVIAQVGGGRRGRRMMLEVWRAHRRHPEACVWCAYALMSDGPLRVLEFMDTVGQLESASSETQADWLGVRALQLAALRDFRGAEDAWSAAKAIWCDPWTWCIEAIIEDRRDRPERARTAVAEARSMQEWFRPAVEIEARLLLRTRQWRAARDLLEEAARRLQSAAVLLSLHERCVEEGDLDRALECVERAIGYLPMSR